MCLQGRHNANNQELCSDDIHKFTGFTPQSGFGPTTLVSFPCEWPCNTHELWGPSSPSPARSDRATQWPLLELPYTGGTSTHPPPSNHAVGPGGKGGLKKYMKEYTLYTFTLSTPNHHLFSPPPLQQMVCVLEICYFVPGGDRGKGRQISSLP